MNLKREITDNLFIRFVPLSWACFTLYRVSISNFYFTRLVIRKFNNDDVEEEEEVGGGMMLLMMMMMMLMMMMTTMTTTMMRRRSWRL